MLEHQGHKYDHFGLLLSTCIFVEVSPNCFDYLCENFIVDDHCGVFVANKFSLYASQLSSCFLICMKEDSIEGIYDTLKECAVISKSAGGIGVSVHNIRATGSYIRGTNGASNGIVPMLRVFNDTARYVDQGGGKRKG